MTPHTSDPNRAQSSADADPYNDSLRYDSFTGGSAAHPALPEEAVNPTALYEDGLLLNFKKEYGAALESLEKAYAAFLQTRDYIGAIRALIELAWLKYNNNRADEASSKASQTFSEAQAMLETHINEPGVQEVRARLLHYKGLVKYRCGQYGEGVKLFRQAKTFCWQDGLEAAKINDSLAIHYERTGDFHRAIRALNESLVIKKRLAIAYEQAVTLEILGRLHLIREAWDDAERCLNEALELCQTLGDVKRLSALRNQRIKMALHRHDVDSARRLIATQEEDDAAFAMNAKERGMTLLFKAYLAYQDDGASAAMQLLCQQAIPQFRAICYDKGLGKAFRLQGRLECELGRHGAALEAMGDALAIFKTLNLVDEQAKTHFEFARIFMEINDRPLAVESLMEALRVAEENGLRFLTSYIEDELYRIDVDQWQLVVDKRATHQRIFGRDTSLLASLTQVSGDAADVGGAGGVGLNSTQAKAMVSLLRVGQAMFGERDLDTLLTVIMNETRLALDCDRCTLFLYDKDRNELWSKVATGLDRAHEIRFPAHLGLAGYVCKTGEILNIRDAYEDPRFNKDVDKKTGYKTENLLCMPMRNRLNEIIGVFQVLNKAQGHFEKSDEELLMAIASHAGVAIENAQLVSDQKTAFVSFIKTLSSTIDARDPITAGHSERVAQYADIIGQQMHLEKDEMESLVYAALLHDIGKIGIREDILTKDGRLTEKEYRHIQQHARYTYEILQNIHFEPHLRRVPEIAASHHEKVDGTGYFRGLKGGEIPLLGRVLALSDVFDAITSRRHYRNRMPFDRVIRLLQKDANSHFDPDCVNAFFNAPLQQLGRILLLERRFTAPETLIQWEKEIDDSLTIREYHEILCKERMTKGEADIHRYFTALYERGSLDQLD
ncbi:MAG: GAF domain-containing protein [Vampirovibrionales bacterium]|nr:GAF domain-containing protein [Vampirovibrionales bacterium]